MQYTVTVAHDEAEGIWFVQTSDVPGLNAEAPTLDALVEAVTGLTPDLVQANGGAAEPISIRVEHMVRTAPAA